MGTENLINLRDVDGLAKIHMKSPQDLFTILETEAKDLAVWVGELVWFCYSFNLKLLVL